MARKHLPRLEQVWEERCVFFITTNTRSRRALLANEAMHQICREVWQNLEHQGWLIGRYVLMPDHAHFFCAPRSGTIKLHQFVGKWKEWSAKYANRRLQIEMPLWQPEYFDHLMRTFESYERKWDYVRENPACTCGPMRAI